MTHTFLKALGIKKGTKKCGVNCIQTPHRTHSYLQLDLDLLGGGSIIFFDKAQVQLDLMETGF